MEVEQIIIRNEDDAWNVLERATAGELDAEHVRIEFEDWPRLNITLKGGGFEGTVTPRVMEGVVDLQKAIYRSYLLARYDTSDLRSLTEEEKDELEIKVKVEKSSTILESIVTGPLNTIANGIADKMDPVHVVITVLGVGLLFFGNSAYRSYLSNKREEKQLDQATKLSEQETERMRIFGEAMNKAPRLATVKEEAEDAYGAVLRASTKAETVNFNGETLETSESKALISKPRSKAKDVRLDGKFRILNVDTTDIDGIKVKMRHEDGRVVTPLIQEGDINMAQRDILKDAEWSGEYVWVALNAKELRNEITGASIIDVREVKDEGQ